MKDRLSSTYKSMLLILGATGFAFIAICFVAFYLLKNLDAAFLSIVIISFILILGVYYYSFSKLVSAPLSLITKILEENDETTIARIQ